MKKAVISLYSRKFYYFFKLYSQYKEIIEDLELNDNQISKFLIALEGVGVIFLGSFLVAYLTGLPTDVVYHSDPTLRMILSVFGGILLIIIIFGLLISAFNKKKS